LNRKDEIEMYEKHYFHEESRRSHINSRAQSTFIAYATVLTMTAYMFKNIDIEKSLYLSSFFYISIALCTVPFIKSILKSKSAFWGNSYKQMPTPEYFQDRKNILTKYKFDIKKYNKDNPKHSLPFPNVEKTMSIEVLNHYKECVTNNATTNTERSLKIHTAVSELTTSSLYFSIAVLIFVLGDMDASSPRKEVLIKHPSTLNTIEKETEK